MLFNLANIFSDSEQHIYTNDGRSLILCARSAAPRASAYLLGKNDHRLCFMDHVADCGVTNAPPPQAAYPDFRLFFHGQEMIKYLDIIANVAVSLERSTLCLYLTLIFQDSLILILIYLQVQVRLLPSTPPFN